MDARRGRAHALLRVLPRSRRFVDALECGELDYDGCDHGWRQLAGSHLTIIPSVIVSPYLITILIKSVCFFLGACPNDDL